MRRPLRLEEKTPATLDRVGWSGFRLVSAALPCGARCELRALFGAQKLRVNIFVVFRGSAVADLGRPRSLKFFGNRRRHVLVVVAVF